MVQQLPSVAGPELSFQHWRHQNKTQNNKKDIAAGELRTNVMSTIKNSVGWTQNIPSEMVEIIKILKNECGHRTRIIFIVNISCVLAPASTESVLEKASP